MERALPPGAPAGSCWAKSPRGKYYVRTPPHFCKKCKRTNCTSMEEFCKYDPAKVKPRPTTTTTTTPSAPARTSAPAGKQQQKGHWARVFITEPNDDVTASVPTTAAIIDSAYIEEGSVNDQTIIPDVETATTTSVPSPMHIPWASIPNPTRPASTSGFYLQDM